MRVLALGLAAAIGAGSAALAADVPVVKPFTAPPPGPQYFLWLEGGYSHFDLADVHAFDFIPSGFATFAPVFFDIDRGWYGRGEAGAFLTQRLGAIDAVSFAVWYRKGDADLVKTGDGAALGYRTQSVTAVATIGTPGDTGGTAQQDFSLLDVQLRLKHAPAAWPGVTLNAEPFLGTIRRDTSSAIRVLSNPPPPFASRSAEIEGRFFGLQAAIEGQRQVSEKLTLRGRASLGGYHMRTEGDFAIAFAFVGDTAFSDSLSRNFSGFRAGAEIGADFALTPNIMFGVTGGIDHWSKLPTARLTEVISGTPLIGIGTESFTDYFVGARLTFVNGAH